MLTTTMLMMICRKLRRVFGADRREGSRRVVLRRPHLRRHPQVQEDPRLAHVPRRSRAHARALRLVRAPRSPPATPGQYSSQSLHQRLLVSTGKASTPVPSLERRLHATTPLSRPSNGDSTSPSLQPATPGHYSTGPSLHQRLHVTTPLARPSTGDSTPVLHWPDPPPVTPGQYLRPSHVRYGDELAYTFLVVPELTHQSLKMRVAMAVVFPGGL